MRLVRKQSPLLSNFTALVISATILLANSPLATSQEAPSKKTPPKKASKAPADDPFGAAPADDPFGAVPAPAAPKPPVPAPADDPFGAAPAPAAPKPPVPAPADDPFGAAPAPAAPKPPVPAPVDDPFGAGPAPATPKPPVPAPADDPFGAAPAPATLKPPVPAPADDPFGAAPTAPEQPAPKGPTNPDDAKSDPFADDPPPAPAPAASAPATPAPAPATPAPAPATPAPAPATPAPAPATPAPAPAPAPAVAANGLPTAPPAPPEAPHPQAIVYVGTYTANTDSQGIYAYRMDLVTGELTSLGLAAKSANPSFLHIHPNGRYLYAVNELTDYEGRETGAVSAFRIDPYTRRLTLLSIYDSGGGAPCHLAMDRTQRHVLVANYVGGSVATFAVRPDYGLTNATQVVQHQGSSVDPKRQTAPHAHSVHVSSDNQFAFVGDLGTDQIVVYRFDPRHGTLQPHYAAMLPPGSGPRHMTFNRQNELLVINEMTATITRMKYDRSNAALTAEQTISTLPADFSGRKSTAEIVAHPSRPFIYGSNRGHDSIAVYRNDRDGLKLVEIEKTGGEEPRNFTIAPGGKFLLAANQKSNTINVFAINQETGELDPTAHSVEAPSPVCVRVRETQFMQKPPRAIRLHGTRGRRYSPAQQPAHFATRVGR